MKTKILLRESIATLEDLSLFVATALAIAKASQTAMNGGPVRASEIYLATETPVFRLEEEALSDGSTVLNVTIDAS